MKHNKEELDEIKLKCKELGIKLTTYYQRRYRGWSKEEALTAPKIGPLHYLPNGITVRNYLGKYYRNYIYFLGKTKNPSLAFHLVLKGHKDDIQVKTRAKN